MTNFKQLLESCLLESSLTDYRNHVKGILDNNPNKNIEFYEANFNDRILNNVIINKLKQIKIEE